MQFSLIIPTVNRPVELSRLLASLAAQTVKPDEILVIVQGPSDALRAVDMYPELPIRTITLEVLSLTAARNRGIGESHGGIVGFVDDDCILEPTYVERILAFFATHPKALGVQGIITNFEAGHTAKVGGDALVYALYSLLAKIFLLNRASSKNRLLLSGRNQYASRVSTIETCEWLSGIGNYRRSVFQEFHFDERLMGYALGEDKLFSYPIYEKYRDSLFVDPSIRCAHDQAPDGRPVGRKQVVMKVRYTAYVWRRLVAKRGLRAGLAYHWANLGDLVVVACAVLLGRESFAYWWWHVVEYWRVFFDKNIIYVAGTK